MSHVEKHVTQTRSRTDSGRRYALKYILRARYFVAWYATYAIQRLPIWLIERFGLLKW